MKKNLAILLSSLFSKELCAALKLQEQQYVLLIPKSIFEKYKISSENITFELILDNNRITLLGPHVPAGPAAAPLANRMHND